METADDARSAFMGQRFKPRVMAILLEIDEIEVRRTKQRREKPCPFRLAAAPLSAVRLAANRQQDRHFRFFDKLGRTSFFSIIQTIDTQLGHVDMRSARIERGQVVRNCPASQRQANARRLGLGVHHCVSDDVCGDCLYDWDRAQRDARVVAAVNAAGRRLHRR